MNVYSCFRESYDLQIHNDGETSFTYSVKRKKKEKIIIIILKSPYFVSATLKTTEYETNENDASVLYCTIHQT